MAKQLDIHEQLVERCKKHDAAAQQQLYALYSKAMYNVSVRIVGTRQDAEDVLQESFVKAFKSIEKFRQDSSFGAWLKRIVVNTSLNAIRSKVRFDSLDEYTLGDYDIEHEAEVESEEFDIEDVKKAVKNLPDGFRAVFSLYMFEDYSHKEIADMLKISVGTSKSQLNRAKKKVKQDLISIGDERRKA